LQVKRSLSKAEPQKRVAIRSLDRLSPKDFIAALTRVFGLDVVCNLKQEQLQALIHVKLCAYHDRGGKVYRLADRVGQQEDGTWVFEDIQFTKDGEITDEETSLWVYNPNLGGEDQIPSPKVVPPDAQALPRLVAAMRRFHGEVSILPALFSMGWSAACFHYQTIMKREKVVSTSEFDWRSRIRQNRCRRKQPEFGRMASERWRLASSEYQRFL
jgi:hypothetical protein